MKIIKNHEVQQSPASLIALLINDLIMPHSYSKEPGGAPVSEFMTINAICVLRYVHMSHFYVELRQSPSFVIDQGVTRP